MNNKRRGPDDAFLKETEALHNLRALEEIEKNPKISQRELSGQLGVALGITNALLKALVRKGLIKIRGDNNRSLSYHLTHSGVLAKGALALKWTYNTIDFYRQARRDVAEKMTELAESGVKTVVLYGIDDLTEIAVLVASEVSLEVKGLVNGEGPERKAILALPIGTSDIIDETKPDAVVVCVEATDAIRKILVPYEKNSGVKTLFLLKSDGT